MHMPCDHPYGLYSNSSRPHPLVPPFHSPLLGGPVLQCPPKHGWVYVSEHGHTATTHAAAYSLLLALHEPSETDRVGHLLLSDLKGLLVGQETSRCPQAERVKQV